MKKLFCVALTIASAAASAQAPPNYPLPTGKDRVHLVDVAQMPLPLPKAELLKMSPQ